MIDEGGVAQAEKNVKLRGGRLTVINGFCLCNSGKAQNVEGWLSELLFYCFFFLFISAFRSAVVQQE